jgi:hypothetical protein
MTYISKKPENIIARSYYDKKTSRFFGIILSLVASVAILVPPYVETGKDMTPLVILGIVLLLSAFNFLAPHYIFGARSSIQLKYNPFKRGMKFLFSSVFGLAVIYLFLYMFYSVGLQDTEEYVMYLMLFFFGIFTIVFGVRIIRSFYLVSKGLYYGASELKVNSNATYTFGDTIEGRISNPRLKDEKLIVKIYNLEEYYSSQKEKKSSNSYVTKQHYVAETLADKNTRGLYEFQFDLPVSGKPSTPSVHRPVYWEIECKGIDSGYKGIFRVKVK